MFVEFTLPDETPITVNASLVTHFQPSLDKQRTLICFSASKAESQIWVIVTESYQTVQHRISLLNLR